MRLLKIEFENVSFLGRMFDYINNHFFDIFFLAFDMDYSLLFQLHLHPIKQLFSIIKKNLILNVDFDEFLNFESDLIYVIVGWQLYLYGFRVGHS